VDVVLLEEPHLSVPEVAALHLGLGVHLRRVAVVGMVIVGLASVHGVRMAVERAPKHFAFVELGAVFVLRFSAELRQAGKAPRPVVVRGHGVMGPLLAGALSLLELLQA